MPVKAKKKFSVARLEGLEDRRLLTTSVWVGTAGDHLFSDPANWQDDTVPASGNDLQFNDLGSPQTVDFDITGINAGNFYVSNAYTFTGHAITLLGDINVGTSSSATFNNTIDIGANSNLSPQAGGTITLGTLADSTADTLTKYGAGTVVLDGNSASNWNLITGTMTINANTQINLSEYGGQGAILNGSGSVGSLSDNAAEVSLNTSSAPSTIATGNIYFDGGTLDADITNATHSELTATAGQVQLLGDPVLNLVLGSGYATTGGTVYTLISNTSGTAVSGTFSGLPQGSTVTAGGETFTISYTGGSTGHNVTLTSVAASPTVAVTSSISSTIVGQSVKLTASVTGSDGTPTGSVTFYSGSTLLGTGTLSGGVAMLTTSSLPAGTDSITAVYGGSSTYTTATSAATSVVVSSTGPIVSVAPSASLATAKAIKLSVTGLDTSTSLTNGLTYTWTSVKVPSGAKPVKFSVNGTNAASTTDAAVSKDGTYTFDVTVKDSAGRTATSVVQYAVRQIARYLDITPTSAKVTFGHHVSFSTTALDQFDHAMRTNSTAVAYSVLSGGGSITSASGVFTASSSKTGKSVIDITLDGLTGEATVTTES